jgi:hypothetical protein
MDHSEVKHLPKVDHMPAQFERWQKILLSAADYIEDNESWPVGHCAWSAMVHIGDDGRESGKCGSDDARKAGMKLSEAIGGTMVCDIFDWHDRQSDRHAVASKMRAVALGL